MSVDPTFEPVPRPDDFITPGDEPVAPVTPSKKPTRKLSYASAAAVVLFLASLVVDDVDVQLEQAINVGLPLILAYFVKNADTPGGVPPATE